MLLAGNFALSGTLAWTPGGYGLVFARMLQDGIVTRYLDDHCPEHPYKLCPYRHRLPATADAFLWSGGPFNDLGRFDGLGQEMRTIVLESLVEYPAAQIKAAIADTAEQLVKVENGEGVETVIFHTYGIINYYLPSVAPAMRAARQQHGEVGFRLLNDFEVPIALISMLLLPLVILRSRQGEFGDLGLLAATVAIASSLTPRFAAYCRIRIAATAPGSFGSRPSRLRWCRCGSRLRDAPRLPSLRTRDALRGRPARLVPHCFRRNRC